MSTSNVAYWNLYNVITQYYFKKKKKENRTEWPGTSPKGDWASFIAMVCKWCWVMCKVQWGETVIEKGSRCPGKASALKISKWWTSVLALPYPGSVTFANHFASLGLLSPAVKCCLWASPPLCVWICTSAPLTIRAICVPDGSGIVIPVLH